MLKSSLIAVACSAAIASALADAPKPIDVPAGALSAALEIISKQAGVELVFRPEQVRGLHTNGVTGTFSAQEAVQKLLEGTPLKLRSDEATGAMMIGRAAPTASADNKAESTDTAQAAPARSETGKAQKTSGDATRWRLRLAQADTSPHQGAAAQAGADRASRTAELTLEEVLVTGTHIRGIDNPTMPVIIMDRAFIDSTGMTTTIQLVESLPQNFALVNQSATGGSLSGNSFSTIQGSTINLRGIGEGTTLTLVNGRRLPLGYDGSAVNIAALPLSAMERVEVLTDGASALYGSDAIGGVVNFVFRRDFEGAESRASYGDADGADDYRLSHIYGRAWQSGSFVIAGEYYSRDILLSSDRDYVVNGGTSVPSLLPEDENTAVTLMGRQSLGENTDVFLDVLYTNRDSYNKSFEIDVTSDANLYIDNSQLSANAGFAWRLGGDWQAELAGSYGEDDLDVDLIDLPSAVPFRSTPIVSQIKGVDAKADGPLFQLPGGLVRVAVGAHWREEDHEYEMTGFDANGAPAPGFQNQFVGNRTVRSVFGEASVPIVGAANAVGLVQRLDLSLAVRYDDYSDFGSSADPRIGLAWQPVSGLKLRGSWGTSYLAPKLKDFDVGFNAVIAIDNFFLANGMHVMQVAGNAPELLKAQESENYTLGVEFAPPAVPGLKLAINYYDIDYRDKIDNVDTIPFERVLAEPEAFGELVIINPTVEQVNEAIAQGERGRPFIALNGDFTPNPNFDPTTVDALFDYRRRNIGVLKQNGFDVSAAYAFGSAVGDFNVALDVAYIDELVKQVTEESTEFDVLDTYANPTHLRARLGLGYRRGGWSLNTFVHRKNAYTDNRQAPNTPIEAYTTVDFNVAYRFAEGTSLLANSSIALSALNLFDEDPPRTRVRGQGYYDLGFDTTNASALGRLLTIDLTKRW
jgi:iron complex outermembrane receptor protein